MPDHVPLAELGAGIALTPSRSNVVSSEEDGGCERKGEG